MNNLPVVRKIDNLGRLVLPIDVRKKLNIMPGDDLEMYINSDNILIKKSNSLQNLLWLATIMIKDLFKIYQIEASLVDDEVTYITTKKDRKNEYKLPIIFNNRQLGYLIIYDYKEEDNKIINFVISIFHKYLEEQG